MAWVPFDNMMLFQLEKDANGKQIDFDGDTIKIAEGD